LTAATTSALRRTTQRVVVGGGSAVERQRLAERTDDLSRPDFLILDHSYLKTHAHWPA
jgi:hypothetical protein